MDSDTQIYCAGMSDTEIYCACMNDLPPRIRFVQAVLSAEVTSGNEFIDAEIVFLQFRKMLEQIAFASLAANKEKYSEARASFAFDWRASKMLKYLEEVNPDFYPRPHRLVSTFYDALGRRRHHLEPLNEGYLTKDDFVELYDHCCDVLHARNPYSGAARVICVGRTAHDWLSRIENLVRLHQARLITGACWIGAVPDIDGRVHTYATAPVEG